MSELSNFSAQNVSVLFYYDGDQQYAHPVRLFWDGEEFELGGVQFWYTDHKADKLVHHYTIGDRAGTYTFELALETENLTWKLEKAEALNVTEDEGVEEPVFGGFRMGGVYA